MAATAVALSDTDFSPSDVTHPALSDSDFKPEEVALSDADFTPGDISAVGATAQVMTRGGGSAVSSVIEAPPADSFNRGAVAPELLEQIDAERNALTPTGKTIATGALSIVQHPLETAKGLGEFALLAREAGGLTTPLVTLPKPQGDNIGAGIVRGAETVIEGLTTPENLGLLATIGGAPAAIQKAASAGFAAMMAKEVPNQAIEAVRAASEGRLGAAAEQATMGLANAAMAGLAGAHVNTRPSIGGAVARTDALAPETAKAVAEPLSNAQPAPSETTPPATPETTSARVAPDNAAAPERAGAEAGGGVAEPPTEPTPAAVLPAQTELSGPDGQVSRVILDKLEGDKYTLRDAANEIVEMDNPPPRLRTVAEALKAAIKEDREVYGERSGLPEEAEAALLNELESRANEAPTQSEQAKIATSKMDVSDITNATTEDDAMTIGGGMLMKANTNQELVAIQSAMKAWKKPPLTPDPLPASPVAPAPSQPPRTVSGESVPASGAIKPALLNPDGTVLVEGKAGQTHGEVQSEAIRGGNAEAADATRAFVGADGKPMTRAEAWTAAKAAGEIKPEALAAKEPELTRDAATPEQMTPDELIVHQKQTAISRAQEALENAKTGREQPNVFVNGFKSKAALVRKRAEELKAAQEKTPKIDLWETMIDAAYKKKPIAVALVDGFTDKAQGEVRSMRQQAVDNLTEKGYIKRGELYVKAPELQSEDLIAHGRTADVLTESVKALDEPIPEHSAAVVKVSKNKPEAELVKGMAEKAREDVKNLGPGAANEAEFAKLREETSREHATIGAAHLMEGKSGKPEWIAAMREEYGMSEATPKELNKIWREAHEMVADFEGAQSGKALRPKAQIEGGIMGRIARTLEDSVSKAKALAGYLSGMEKGAKMGGAARQAQIRMADKWMAADYAQARTDLLDFAKNLPPDQRGKFIPAITEALKRIPVLSKNAPELLASRAVDVMNRITAAVYDVNLKQTIGKIEKLLAKNEEAKNITVPERQMIRQRGVTFNALKDKMSLDMLEAMHARMKEIRAAGKDLFVLDEVVKAEKVKATIREIQKQGTRKIDTPEQLRVALGETETTWARRLNELRRVPEFIKHFNLAWTPFDWLVQTFDKATGGAIRQTMKLPVDVLYGEWLDSSGGYKKPLREIAKRNKLTPGNLDRIGVHAELRQEGGLENIQSKGYTKKEIDSARTLTRGELEFLRESDRINNEIMPQVQKVLADYFHTEIKKVQGYFPRQRDWDYYSTLSIEEGRFAQAHNRTNTEKGSTISRVGAVTKNRTNALDIMEKHIDDALYHIKLGPEIRRLADTVKTPEFAESTGTWGQKVFSDWVDVLSRNGGVGSGRRIPAMDTIRKNIGMAQLAWRLTTTALQPLSLIQGMAVTSPKNMGRALSMMASKANREFVLKNFPEIRHRVGDDPAYSDYGGASVRDKLARGGFYGISKLDRLSAMTTGLGKYLDSLEAAGVKFDPADPVRMESVQDAQLAVRQTQSSTYPKDLPLAISRGNFTKNASVDKAIGQFQNFLINKWALTKNGALQMGIEEKSPKAGARIMAFLILGTIAEQLGREGIKRAIMATIGETDKQKQDDKKAEKEGDVFALEIAKRAAIDMVTGMPIVSNIAGVAKYDGSGLPLLDVPKNLIEGGVKMATGAKPSTKIAGGIRAAQGIGALLGVPTGQLGDAAVQAVRANKDKIDPKKAKSSISLGGL